MAAGGALAVDRSKFSQFITERISKHPLINVERKESKFLPLKSQIAVIASGPLTSDDLAIDIRAFTGLEECHFFDAASPIVEGESIDLSLSLIHI